MAPGKGRKQTAKAGAATSKSRSDPPVTRQHSAYHSAVTRRKDTQRRAAKKTTIVIKNRSRRDVQLEDPESEGVEDEVIVAGAISEDTAEVEPEELTPFPSDDEALQQRIDQPSENEAVPEDEVILPSAQSDQEAPSPKPLELKFEILSQLKLLVNGKPPKQQPDNTRVIVRIKNATDLNLEVNSL
ncbi:hypothetical protein DL764_000331 [Monosporascus ibericus]|uniref:Uncharacterized protein n=1 Tax=Monosporascus ibericus TaxID=155417 RepID=A0A4Q4TTR8_9PEZI|nr:hypothetical protein DL764_000331 [Monosporascus ibericus]